MRGGGQVHGTGERWEGNGGGGWLGVSCGGEVVGAGCGVGKVECKCGGKLVDDGGGLRGSWCLHGRPSSHSLHVQITDTYWS